MACPAPVTGKSISIFDFNLFVWAGEAKLREGVRWGLLNAGPWSCKMSSTSAAYFEQ